MYSTATSAVAGPNCASAHTSKIHSTSGTRNCKCLASFTSKTKRASSSSFLRKSSKTSSQTEICGSVLNSMIRSMRSRTVLPLLTAVKVLLLFHCCWYFCWYFFAPSSSSSSWNSERASRRSSSHRYSSSLSVNDCNRITPFTTRAFLAPPPNVPNPSPSFGSSKQKSSSPLCSEDTDWRLTNLFVFVSILSSPAFSSWLFENFAPSPPPSRLLPLQKSCLFVVGNASAEDCCE